MSTREGTFTIGVKNVGVDRVNEIEILIMKKLQEIEKKGLDKNLVDLAINQIELNSKIPKSDFGITFLNNILSFYATTDEPLENSGLELLNCSENMKKIRDSLKKNSKLFEKLIKEYFIDNEHRVRIVMNSDNNFIKDQYESEKKNLAKIERLLTAEEKEKIVIQVCFLFHFYYFCFLTLEQKFKKRIGKNTRC